MTAEGLPGLTTTEALCILYDEILLLINDTKEQQTQR